MLQNAIQYLYFLLKILEITSMWTKCHQYSSGCSDGVTVVSSCESNSYVI